MENPSMDSMNFGVLGANLATFQSNSPNLSPPRCVSSETDLGSGDGDCGGETEEGDLGREVGTSRLTNDLDPYGSASTGIEEPTSRSDFGTGDGDGGGESEGTEHLEVSMSRTSYHIDTDVSFSPRIHEPLLADTTDNCSPDSPRPWKKREPLAGRKTAIEGAIRMFGDRDTAYVMAPKIGMEFDSLQEAYDFYNLYSWEIGFGIRYGPYRKNPSNSKIGPDIVCGCSEPCCSINHNIDALKVKIFPPSTTMDSINIKQGALTACALDVQAARPPPTPRRRRSLGRDTAALMLLACIWAT